MSSETLTEPKLSPVEGHKVEGRFLRGTLAEEVADPAVEHLSESNKSLIKFHGSYQQEDRDARKNRAKAGVGKAYMFMIRLKLPGGKLTADQYLAMDDICGEVRQRHAARHHAAELPVPRRAEAEPEGHDRRRSTTRSLTTLGGVRRHEPQRHLPARPRCRTRPAS